MDIEFKLKNVLPEDLVDKLAEYWCDGDDSRSENLGEVIQRIAEVTLKHYGVDK